MRDREIAAAGDVGALARWVERWEAAMKAARTKGQSQDISGPMRVVVDRPATAKELGDVEMESGITMPSSLRRLFSVARSVDAVWWLADDVEPPKPFQEIFSGGCEWSLDRVPSRIESYLGWVETVFPNPNDPYDAVWQGKYPFLEVRNGDLIAVDDDGRVTYLSHDDGAGHGYVLGADVFDFLDTWTKLGSPGPEDWQWFPFASSTGAALDPDSENGRAWRTWFGLA